MQMVRCLQRETVNAAAAEVLFLRARAAQVAATGMNRIRHVQHSRIQALLLHREPDFDAVSRHDLGDDRTAAAIAMDCWDGRNSLSLFTRPLLSRVRDAWLRPGGVLVMFGMLLFPTVEDQQAMEALHESLPNETRITTAQLPVGCGIQMMVKLEGTAGMLKMLS